MRVRDAVFAEFLGTLLLFAITAGSDIAAARSTGSQDFGTLMANSLATGFGISALILSLNPVSGACFNPLAAVLLCLYGELRRRQLPGYLLAQFGGALLGVLLIHYLCGFPLLEVAQRDKSGLPLFWSEFVGTGGLLLVIHRVGNTRSQWVAYAVGAYLMAATWALPSNSIANPALTVARMLTDTYPGIRPADAAGYLVARCLALGAIVVFLRCHKRFSPLGD